MYSAPVQFSLFDEIQDNSAPDGNDTGNQEGSEQLTFEFMTRGEGDKDTGDLQSMRM